MRAISGPQGAGRMRRRAWRTSGCRGEDRCSGIVTRLFLRCFAVVLCRFSFRGSPLPLSLLMLCFKAALCLSRVKISRSLLHARALLKSQKCISFQAPSPVRCILLPPCSLHPSLWACRLKADYPLLSTGVSTRGAASGSRCTGWLVRTGSPPAAERTPSLA
jgi:hypothetical protein